MAFTRQAPWLVAAGIFDEIAASGAPASAQARMLLDGEGMGEEIRVLVQSRGCGRWVCWTRRSFSARRAVLGAEIVSRRAWY